MCVRGVCVSLAALLRRGELPGLQRKYEFDRDRKDDSRGLLYKRERRTEGLDLPDQPHHL